MATWHTAAGGAYSQCAHLVHYMALAVIWNVMKKAEEAGGEQFSLSVLCARVHVNLHSYRYVLHQSFSKTQILTIDTCHGLSDL